MSSTNYWKNSIFREKRKAMDIEGLGGETVALLFNNDLVHNYADLYKLTVEQILPLERMAQKSADNLVKGWRFKNIPFERVYMLWESDVGETVAKIGEAL
jgi:DNA ligase (NAD+)